MSATVTVTAEDDSEDDDGESITIGFGALPTGVSAGSPDTTTVSLADNDDPAVTVQFGAASYTATEDGTAATVAVTLSADPERTVSCRCRSHQRAGRQQATTRCPKCR